MMFEKILIVEDEFIIAEDIRTSLQSIGHHVIAICSNGEEAYQKAFILKPDLLLLDVILEGEISGIDLAIKIREDFMIPIIYITAHSDVKTLEKAAQTMPYGYLLKPFEEEELYVALKIAYHKHNMELACLKKEKKYRLLLENMPELMKVTDESGNIVFMSHFIEKLLGYPLADITNNDKWLTLIHQQDLEKTDLFYRNIKFINEFTECEYRMKNKEFCWVKIKEKVYPYITTAYGKLFYSVFSPEKKEQTE
jgi:PAS domain S-box-containing protein